MVLLVGVEATRVRRSREQPDRFPGAPKVQESAQTMYRAQQETKLLDAVRKARAVSQKPTKGPGGGGKGSKQPGVPSSSGSEALDSGGVEGGASSVLLAKFPPPPPIKLKPVEEEMALVQTLDTTKFDPSRTFPGLVRQKIEKKERHAKAVDAWTKLLDTIAEKIEQDVLQLSRDMNESVAAIDERLQSVFNQLQQPAFLIPRSEDDLFHQLDELKSVVAGRSRVIDTFAGDMDALEIKRAEVVGTELKLLVDRLIAIAHQLPDEIEHIVESETFDLNSVLTINRKAHAQLLGLLRKRQIEVEVETLQRWEDGRRYWRQLRHDKGVAEFLVDINSDRFTNPQDRQDLMYSCKDQQARLKSRRIDVMDQFAKLTSENINSASVVELQKRIAVIADDELADITDCYKQLCDLRANLKMSAEDRVEALRKELHTYGALHDEPPMKQVSLVMQHALEDASLAELWRLGGGLKGDFQSLASDVVSVDVCYERLVSSVEERLKAIACGFNLKAVLEERGRLMQLDKVRNLITKLRGVPRTEVPAVISGLVPELEDMIQMEQTQPLFKKIVSDCIAEMNADMERVRLQPGGEPHASTMGSPKTTAKKSSAASRQTGKSTAGGKKDKTGAFIDPSLVKSWSRKLGVVYYGSDLPSGSQQACIDGISMIQEQRECNRLIDAVVAESGDKILRRMDAQYQKLNDAIANFLENQSSYVSVCLSNLGEYFLRIAKLVEEHRKEQRTLDEKSADELFDLSEDFRIEREDREVLFEQACQVLRASTALDELLENFDKVLLLLETIQASYRTYHGKACFAADKYPLMLVDEFRRYITRSSDVFSMNPHEEHPIIRKYHNIFDETIRFNKKFFEADPAAGGVEPRPVAVAVTTPAAEEDGEPAAEPAPETSSAPVELYTSPLVGKAELSLAGIFVVNVPLEAVAAELTVEKEAPGEEGADAVMNSGDATGPTTSSSYKPPAHPECQWIRASNPLPLSEEDESALDDFDRLEYENGLAKSFIALDEAAISVLSPESQVMYRRCEEISASAKARIAIESESSYVRSHVPLDSQGNPWVLVVDIAIDDLVRIIGGIRDSVVTTVEMESARRLARALSLATDNKTEFTEELEDRLRTHWPRRGRVETGIKQPRETELLSHEEKTWRHIQNIQQRMIDLQKKFNFGSEEAKKSCDDYVNDITALRNSLSNSKFRNLAALQGVDMKARALTIGFQGQSSTAVAALRKITTEDVATVVSCAMDFRKVCPPQAPGVEGGYSEAEILEIEALVVGQCEESKKVAEQWHGDIEKLIEQQEQSVKSHGEFTKRYEKCAQDLAMSEGLGQKYGAPRRRAQERIRTEIARDEQAAGKLDELLAKVQFICDETKRRVSVGGAQDQEELGTAAGAKENSNGRAQLEEANQVWSLLGKLRAGLQARAEYLRVVEVPIATPELVWLVQGRIPSLETTDDAGLNDLGDGPADTDANAVAQKQTCLEDVFVEVDAACRKETRELYESEGMGSVLGEGGVPEALKLWLLEAKERLLGPTGHRVKAWKRLWAQTTRLELVLGRKPAADGEEDEEAPEEQQGDKNDISAPAACMRLVVSAFSYFSKYERQTQEKQFAKLVRIWEKGREKHERLLRPRLGSPDAADELAELDALEQSRSKEFTEGVVKFQGQLARTLVEHAKAFCEDIGVSCKGLIQYVDSSMRLDALKLPPDTAIPKKRMTLKRLRKAQRIKAAVSQGAPDLSHDREWPPLPFDTAMQAIAGAEVLVPDLTVPEPVAAAPAEPAKKGAPPPKKGEPAPVVQVEAPTLVSRHWKETLASTTAVKGAVTTAHRIVVRERDSALAAFVQQLEDAVKEISSKYSALLEAEKSWIQRWARQVATLRSGSL